MKFSTTAVEYVRVETAAMKKNTYALPIMLRRKTKNWRGLGTPQIAFLIEQLVRRIKKVRITMPKDLKKPN